jgi:hypothetical protein
MGLIKITADMTDAERTAVLNSNLQYLQLSNRLRKYPVGMIVAFDTDIDPNELYGGTWERIKGAFIWGIDDGETAGVTGGEKTHTLTEAELPAIDGRIATAVVSNHGANGVTGHAYGTDFGPATETIGGAKGAAGTQYGYGYKFGSGQAHNNMPPFYGAYIWRKTAHGIGEDPTLTEYEAMMKQLNDALSETKTLCNLLFSNALRGSASGETINLTDVSPNEHTLGVKVSGKNLFDKDNANIIIGYPDAENVINGASSTRSVYIPCAPNATYTVSKTLTARFAVAFTDDIPSNGVAVTGRVQNNTASSITTTSGINSKYIVVWLYHVDLDTTTIKINEVLATLQIELGSTATDYTPYISDFSGVTLKKCKKNLLENPNIHAYNYSTDYKKYNSADEILLPAGTYSISASKNMPTLQFWNKETKAYYTVDEVVSAYSTNTYYKIYDGRALGRATDAVNQMYFALKKEALITLNSGVSTGTTAQCQLELGSTVTSYEPYQGQTYTPTADGTVSGVTSLYPSTTLMTDTEGAIISAEYNRDINKAFAELQQAIISSGGNV